MPMYPYRCASCGPFEVRRAIGAAGPLEPCAGCGEEARRVFTPPLISRTAPALSRALAAQEASAAEPQVVRRANAPAPRPAPPTDPRHARLPRP